MLVSQQKNATPYRFLVLPLLNRRGWKQLVMKRAVYTEDILWC
jgi:hypothetical protein